MEIEYLKTLCAVLDRGSFSKAAGDLCITQSAVSQRIKLMEERYSTPLIDRTGQSIRPTDAGQIIRDKAEQILMIEKEIERELRALGKKRRLYLCSTPTFGIIYLPKVLNRFFLEHSEDVDFSFALNTPEESIKRLLDNEFDMAIIEHCTPLDGVDATLIPLPPDELIFISAPSLGLPENNISLEPLLKQRLIARREGCSSRYLLQKNLSLYGKTMEDFNGMIIYDDLHLTIQTVQEGRGVAFVSKILVKELVKAGKLSVHTVDGFHCMRSRSVLIRRNCSEDLLIKDFVNNISEIFDSARDVSDPTSPEITA